MKQTWLGYSLVGNGGSGLGRDFARAFTQPAHDLRKLRRRRRSPKGSHLEKLCLIKDGVGRDNISDFTTNLDQGLPPGVHPGFALEHLDARTAPEVPCREGGLQLRDRDLGAGGSTRRSSAYGLRAPDPKDLLDEGRDLDQPRRTSSDGCTTIADADPRRPAPGAGEQLLRQGPAPDTRRAERGEFRRRASGS